ncbi:MAG: hypothetical protein M1457_05980 [bacterium]|nr:hypothetical protein [bacterium]
MRCERVQFYYEDYCRLSLPVSTLARVEDHLAGCPACREYFEKNDQIARLLRDHAEVAHPGPGYFDDLAGRVMARLDEQPPAPVLDCGLAGVRPASASRRPLWWAGAAAAAGLLILSFVPPARQPDVQLARKLAEPAVTGAMLPAEGVSVAEMLPANPLTGGTIFDKGLSGFSSNRPDVESIIQAQLHYPVENADWLPETEPDESVAESAPPASPIQWVSTRPKSERPDSLPNEVLEQLERIKTQMAAKGDEALIAGLREFDQTIQRLSAENASLGDLPMVQQARYYLKGDDAFTAGRASEAWKFFHRVITLDEKSPLATRARLQMADLNYAEWADFRQARDYYQRCAGRAAEQALTAAEREHVTRQLDRLDRYAGNSWEALHLVYCVRRGDWPESLAALRGLTALEGSRDLLPEAARAAVDRMKSAPAPPANVTNEIYNLLAKQAQVEQNGEIRAWLELAVGDLLIDQLNNPQQAMVFYHQAIEAAAESGAAKAARVKLYDLEDRNLKNDLVRN